MNDIELYVIGQVVARENMFLALAAMGKTIIGGADTDASRAVEAELKRRGILDSVPALDPKRKRPRVGSPKPLI